MTTVTTDFRTTDGLSPTNVQLLRSPLDFIAEDHLRLRTMCAEIDRLAGTHSIPQKDLGKLTAYLTQELPLLLADEDDDLMPLLLRRAEDEDDLPKLAARLDQEHRKISGYLQDVLDGLAQVGPDSAMTNDLRNAMKALADATRRHLILENAVLMPLARARLWPQDLATLCLAMLRRRGLEGVFSANTNGDA